MTADRLIEVENLRISFRTRSGTNEAVRGVSFSMGREKLGIVGESGSGKSLTGKAILGLVPDHAKVSADRLTFDGEDLQKASRQKLRMIRGRRIGLVMQDPKYCLNPVKKVGTQIAEACRVSKAIGRSAARTLSLDILKAVQIDGPERVYDAHPHELSGGMAQRVMMAMMIVGEPDLLIADEPTSALDVTVQLEVLALLDRLVEARGMGLIFISHDLRLVAQFCDRVAVMYAGKIVEMLPANELHQARHEYTRGLMNCLPEMDQPLGTRLPVLQRDALWLTA